LKSLFFNTLFPNFLFEAVTVQPSSFTVTESAHFKVCLRQRGGFPATPIHWLLTAQQVRGCRLNCYTNAPSYSNSLAANRAASAQLAG